MNQRKCDNFTHPTYHLDPSSAAFALRILREPQQIFRYAVRQVAVRPPSERPLPKY